MDTKLLRLSAVIGTFVLLLSVCAASPKFDSNSSKGFTTGNNQWKRSYKENDTASAATSDRTERLGYTSGYGGGGSSGYGGSGYGSSVNGYSNSGVSPYSPMKIDLGGVILGAIIGIGALLIVPKFLSAIHGNNGGIGGVGGSGYGSYGSNYRSEDGSDPMTAMLAKLDEFLGKNNIDSTVCMQRAVCTYVRQSSYHQTMGTADQTDQIINALTGNALVEYMLDGTAVKEALKNGKDLNADSCDKLYTGCPLDKHQSLQVLSKLLPNVNANANATQ